MIKVHDMVYVGNEIDCRPGSPVLAVVHACKTPCHQRAVGYKGSLPSDHPNYLFFCQPYDLYLNIIDPPKPIFKAGAFHVFLIFAGSHVVHGRSVLIHCNQGESRAPSLALLLLAKVIGVVSNESYESARADFEKLFRNYRPGLGIQAYLSEHWYDFDCPVF